MKIRSYLKKLILILTVGAVFFAFTAQAHSTVNIIDVTYEGEPMMRSASSMLIDGITYVPLRAFCTELGAIDVRWNDSAREARISTAGLEISAAENQKYITVNQRPFYSGANNLLQNGTLYVPIRSIAKAYGLQVEWCISDGSAIGYVDLVPEGGRAEHASNVYDAEVLYWLSRIISAESRGESLVGQIAVGNVVLNRTRNENFPSTVYDVIFDTKYGVQFTPISNGTIYDEPAESSMIAAKICLEGYSVSSSILYFMNTSLSTNMWVSNNRPYVMTLGNHTFYS